MLDKIQPMISAGDTSWAKINCVLQGLFMAALQAHRANVWMNIPSVIYQQCLCIFFFFFFSVSLVNLSTWSLLRMVFLMAHLTAYGQGLTLKDSMWKICKGVKVKRKDCIFFFILKPFLPLPELSLSLKLSTFSLPYWDIWHWSSV